MAKKLAWVTTGLLLAGGAATAWLWVALAVPAPPRDAPSVVVVESGEPLRSVAEKLEAEGLVRSATAFVWLARFRGLDRRVRSGEYELPGGQSALEVLDALAFGQRRLEMVTVPEGLTADETAALLEGAGLGDASRFRALARDAAFARPLALPGEPAGLEGYLFPDTYAFRRDAAPEEVLGRMARRFAEVFTPEISAAAAQAGLTAHQAVTLASLIEKEAAVDVERPIVSAVFHNRLRRGMPLQSDPTAVYGVAERTGPVRHADLARPTSHNTYLVAGLPPGPIANPGRASLEAAVRPAPGVTALYFVARNDRTHEFNDTLEAHERAVGRWQRGGR